MSTGHGPENQQQQPQWGHAAPAPMPGGNPQDDGANWHRVKLLGMCLLIGTVLLLVVRLGINLAAFIGADAIAANSSSGELGALGVGTGLATIVLLLANLLLSIIMLVLGILSAVAGRERARVGGIMIAVAIPVSVVLYWILNLIVAVILLASGVTDASSGDLPGRGYRISSAVDSVRAVLMVAVIGIGSFLVHSTARKQLSR